MDKHLFDEMTIVVFQSDNGNNFCNLKETSEELHHDFLSRCMALSYYFYFV